MRLNRLAVSISIIITLAMFLSCLPNAKANNNIHIKPDGTIEPSTAPITQIGNTYHLTTDVLTNGILIDRNNSIFNGNGYSITGTGDGYGICLNTTTNVTVRNTLINSFEYGILASQSRNTTLVRNNIIQCDYGLSLSYSTGAKLRLNRLADNDKNLNVIGLKVTDFIIDIDPSNTVNDKPIIYWMNKQNISVPLDAGYVALINCSNIKAEKLSLHNVGQAIMLVNVSNSIVSENNISDAVRGVEVFQSRNISISNNIIIDNEYGIALANSTNNSIHMNKMVNNTYGTLIYDSKQNNVCQNYVEENNQGIWLWWSDKNCIYQNVLSTNHYGVVFWDAEKNRVFENSVKTSAYDGIVLYESAFNEIFGNNITANTRGIWLRYSSENNNISKNFISENEKGFYLADSKNNTIIENNLMNNTFNFSVEGGVPEHFIQLITDTNSINGKPIIYELNLRNIAMNFSPSQHIGYLGLVNCKNVTLRFTTLMNNGQGLLLSNTSNSKINDCNFRQNENGIWLGWSINNTISVNNISGNHNGMQIHASFYNKIYYNNFLNNTNNAYPQNTSDNLWDDGYPFGGNFWSDYDGLDLHSGVSQNETGPDGIGDNPYVINLVNIDFYPLMKMRFRILTDLNTDGYVGIEDLIIAVEAFGSSPLKPRWDSRADINRDNYVGIDDILLICKDFSKRWR